MFPKGNGLIHLFFIVSDCMMREHRREQKDDEQKLHPPEKCIIFLRL